MVTVNVKWNRQVYAVEVDEEDSPEVFMSQLFSCTNVPPTRQTVIGFASGKLRHDQMRGWRELGLRDGMTVLMLGTPEAGVAGADASRRVRDDLDGPEVGVDAGDASDGREWRRQGLVNTGNTCYMNATVQCLAQVPELVQRSLRLAAERGGGVPEDANWRLARAYGQLMRALFESAGETSSNADGLIPSSFLSALRATYPQFAQTNERGLFMQQDAEECLSQLLTSLAAATATAPSTSAPGGPAPNPIDDLFSIELQTVDTCQESADEPPVASVSRVRLLACHISRTVNHLHEGVREGLEESIQRHSAVLAREATWKRTSRIQRLPRYLNIHFVRFFWKPVEKVKAKILRKVTFPKRLDVYEFCTEELQAELKRERAAREARPTDHTEDEATGDVRTGMYELCAVLTHQGRTAEAGHYVAWVKQDAQWLKFDDDAVSPVTEEQVMSLCGGGDWHTAYICFYRAVPWRSPA